MLAPCDVFDGAYLSSYWHVRPAKYGRVMALDLDIVARIRQSIPPEMSYAELAARLEITTDELACLMNTDPDACNRPHSWFQRVPGGFASAEVAILAEILDVEFDWLLFGESGPPQHDPMPTISDEELEDPPQPVSLVELAAACGLLDEIGRSPFTTPPVQGHDQHDTK